MKHKFAFAFKYESIICKRTNTNKQYVYSHILGFVVVCFENITD